MDRQKDKQLDRHVLDINESVYMVLSLERKKQREGRREGGSKRDKTDKEKKKKNRYEIEMIQTKKRRKKKKENKRQNKWNGKTYSL